MNGENVLLSRELDGRGCGYGRGDRVFVDEDGGIMDAECSFWILSYLYDLRGAQQNRTNLAILTSPDEMCTSSRARDLDVILVISFAYARNHYGLHYD